MLVPKRNSPALTVENAEQMRDFYVKNFGAKVIFDCGWYINVRLGACDLCFMQPQGEGHKVFSGQGLTYNFEVDDVDAEHTRLKSLGLDVIVPLEDHPWGDRGFAVADPAGVALYFYQEIEPAPEFRRFHK